MTALLAEVPPVGLVDPTAPGYLDDPYPHLAAAREHAPVHQHPNGVYMVFRYDDVHQVLSDPALSSSESYALDAPRNLRLKAAGATDEYLLRPSLSKLDRPEHTPLRKLLARPFTPRAIERYNGRTAELTEGLLAGKGPGDELELVGELAYPLPYLLTCEILGIPPLDDNSQLLAWTYKGLNLLDPFLTAEQFRDYTAAQREFAEYLHDVVAWKRGHLGDDALSGFIAAGDEGTVIGPHQVAATVHTLFLAAFDTTVNQTGISVLALMRQRDQWDRLVADPSLVDAAVEELLRFEPTAQYMLRVTREDYTVGGYVIPGGNHVLTWIASANRDADRFGPTADRVDITRPNARDHLAFGSGPHACLGSWLARLELRTVLRALVQRAPGMRLVEDEVRWGGTSFIRGLADLRLRLDRAP